MNQTVTQLYTLDYFLKTVSIRMAINEIHRDIRDTAADALARCWQGDHIRRIPIAERATDYFFDILRKYMPYEYVMYGRWQVEERRRQYV